MSLVEKMRAGFFGRTGLMVIVGGAVSCAFFAGYAVQAAFGSVRQPIPRVVRIEAMAHISGEKPIPSNALVPGSSDPTAGAQVFYHSPGGLMQAGIWESDPGTLRLHMDADEYVYVLQGRAIIRGTDGKTWTFKPGDAFVLPAGFDGEAKMIGHFRKEFVDVQKPSGGK